MSWTNERPNATGWYATRHSWDSDEGAFLGVHWWDGTQWKDASGPFGEKSSRPIFQWSSSNFTDPKDADEWAWANDPEI